MTMVTVRGAGIFGLAVAWSCLSRGARVRVVDPAGPAAGASGGVVGALTPFMPDPWSPLKALQLASLTGTESFWAEVDEVSGQSSGYGRLERTMPLADDVAVARAKTLVEAAAARWDGAGTWQVEAADDWTPSPTDLIAVETLAARIHPRRATESLAAALRRRGVEIVPEAPDEGAVVWATGYAGLRELGLGKGIKGQGATLGYDAGNRRQVNFPGGYVVPHANGTVGLGSTAEPDRTDTRTDAQLDALVAAAVEACPPLAGAPVIERWAGVRPRADTRQPVLGPLPERPGHFIANGAFKIGFGLAVGVGRLMADLVVEGRDEIAPPFRVETAMNRAKVQG